MTTEHRYCHTCKNKEYKGHSSTNHLTIRQQNLKSKHRDSSNFNLKHISKIYQFLTMSLQKCFVLQCLLAESSINPSTLSHVVTVSFKVSLSKERVFTSGVHELIIHSNKKLGNIFPTSSLLMYNKQYYYII